MAELTFATKVLLPATPGEREIERGVIALRIPGRFPFTSYGRRLRSGLVLPFRLAQEVSFTLLLFLPADSDVMSVAVPI